MLHNICTLFFNTFDDLGSHWSINYFLCLSTNLKFEEKCYYFKGVFAESPNKIMIMGFVENNKEGKLLKFSLELIPKKCHFNNIEKF